MYNVCCKVFTLDQWLFSYQLLACKWIVVQMLDRHNWLIHLPPLSNEHSKVTAYKIECSFQENNSMQRTIAWQEPYMIASASKIFVGSIRDDLWCRGRPSGASFSFLEGAVTGNVGSALDQKGSSILKNLWRNEPVNWSFVRSKQQALPSVLENVSARIRLVMNQTN